MRLIPGTELFLGSYFEFKGFMYKTYSFLSVFSPKTKDSGTFTVIWGACRAEYAGILALENQHLREATKFFSQARPSPRGTSDRPAYPFCAMCGHFICCVGAPYVRTKKTTARHLVLFVLVQASTMEDLLTEPSTTARDTAQRAHRA